jgi:hypothetical protein
MSRTRDLSGFGTTPKRDATEPSPARTPRSSGTRRAAGRKAGSSKATRQPAVRRITLSLPTALAEELKAATSRAAGYYLDVILTAFVEHADEVRSARNSYRSIGDLTVAPPRRRLPPGRTQIPLNIGEDALREIDRTATELGLDRSSFIGELLDRAL